MLSHLTGIPNNIRTMQQLLSLLLTLITVQAQSTAPAYVPKQSDRPQAIVGDEQGFTPIFDGKSLTGWEGDPKYWRVEDGCLVGEITPETLIRSNTFIVWKGGHPRDFELKVEVRISAQGNSGINYRSAIIPDPVTPANRFAMRGYQFDIDGAKDYTGNNYEEKGRLFLALRGQVTRVTGGRPPVLLSRFGDPAQLAAAINGEWNTVHIIARGNVLTHIVNGRLMSMVIDDDAPNRPEDGFIGVQVHVGPPMKVEYRNIRVKLAATPTAQVLDVRTKEEFATGHLANATLIPWTDKNFTERAAKELDPRKPVLVYCQGGVRSAKAAAALVKLGFTDVRDLAGGILAWQQAGKQIDKPAPKS